MKRIFSLMLGTALLMLPTSCSQNKGWSVSGTVDGAPTGTHMALEANNGNNWYLVDSVAVDSRSRFSYKADAPAPHSEIMRLKYKGELVYFPVAGVDAISVDTYADRFGSAARVSGTPLAETIAAIDSTVASISDTDSLRRRLVEYITADTTGIVAYYTIGKSVGGKLLFDPAEDLGNRVYGAAAQVFATYRPLDPRGAALRRAFFEGRKAMGRVSPRIEPDAVITLPETGIIDIERYDSKGNLHRLSDVVGKGKVVLLSFTAYDMAGSPSYNAALYELYTRYQPNIEIFQVAFDDDEVQWKEAARPLPWIAVWNAPVDGSTLLAQYNVGAIPMTYIIDRNGDLGARVVNPADLPKTIARYF